ncbi:MAG: ATP-binding protein [Acidaminobacteraceae bacterium]
MLVYKKKFGSSFEIVDSIVREIIEKLNEYEKLNISTLLFRISFMLRELLNNGVEHGNKFDESKFIYCEIIYHADILEFIIRDEGEGIILQQEDTDIDVLSERERGIATIRKLGFELRFNGTTVHVKYCLKDFCEEELS